MALPKLLQKLFQNGGAGSKLKESIMPFAYAKSVNGKYPDSVGNIEIPARNVGDEWHSFTGQIPAGGVPYCGQEVTRTTYADLWDWVQAHGLVKTETEWQSLSASQNGNVPFYSSGDGSTTFRMPKVVGYIKGAESQAEAGAYTAEGLPNITGSYDGFIANGSEQAGALYFYHDRIENFLGTNTSVCRGLQFDASRSNEIYGNSERVTPETSVILFGVYAFGEITNVGELDADTLATGLASVETGLASVETGLASVETGLASVETGLASVETGLASVESKMGSFVSRNFVLVDALVCSGNAGIAGTYDLGLSEDKVRIGVFSCVIQTSVSGGSTLELFSDVLTRGGIATQANNGHKGAAMATIPFKRYIKVGFPDTSGGVVAGTAVHFEGYFE